MALRMIDSFDHYPTAMLARKWTNDSCTISAGNGRRGTASLRIASPNNTSIWKAFTAHATWIVGFSMRVGSFSGSGTQVAGLISLEDSNSIQTDVRILNTGALRVTRNGTTLATSSPGVIVAGTTYYIEFKATIANSGSYELRLNGATLLSDTGVDTQNTANATANVVRIGSGMAAIGLSNLDVDDLYICDGSGSTNNDFLGDCRVDCYFPNGNGNSSDFVGNDGNSVDNYALVDETSVNSDTDYVESSNVGDHDTYAFGDISHSPTDIFGVQINMFAKKTDAGYRSIQSVIRSGGSDTDGTARPLGTDYTDELQMAETDPDTAAAWTESGFNSAEFGVKVAA